MSRAAALRRSPKKTTIKARSRWEPSPNFFPVPRPSPTPPSATIGATQWKGELPSDTGASLIEMLDEASAGDFKAMFIVGENPVGSLPAATRCRGVLRKLDFLVCQELFLTETAALGPCGVAGRCSAGKTGTFTNTEGHVQAVRPAIEPVGESRPDWEIFSALSMLLGSPLSMARARTSSRKSGA